MAECISDKAESAIDGRIRDILVYNLHKNEYANL